MAEMQKEEFHVLEVKKGERVKKAPLPFTTSTLQQEASKALNFPISKTMRIAQQLYEGVDVKGQGTVGLITYLRTDSVRISEEADAQARNILPEIMVKTISQAKKRRKRMVPKYRMHMRQSAHLILTVLRSW